MRWAVVAAAVWFVAMPQERIYAVNPYPIQPTPLHVALAQMVAGCLSQIGAEIVAQPIGWWVADQLVTEDGAQPYGMYSPPTVSRSAAIVLRTEYHLHPSVITHELVHALAKDGEHDHTAMRHCTIVLPGGLDSLPRLSADSMDVIRARHGGGIYPR